MSEVSPFECDLGPKSKALKLVLIGIACSKFPLFVLISAFSFIYSIIGLLFPIRVIGRAINVGASKVLLRVLLAFFGIFSVPEQPTPLVDYYSETEDTEDPRAGDVIVCNLSSYLNIFWLQAKFVPIYAIPVDEENVVMKSFWQLFIQIIGSTDLRSGRRISFAKAVQIAKAHRTELVIFPEGAVTNGRSIIEFQDFGIGYELGDTKFHVLGLIQNSRFCSANFVHGNGLLHVAFMLGRVLAGMKVKVALPQDIPNPKGGKIDAAFVARCRHVLSRIIGVPCVSVHASDAHPHAKRHID